MMASCGSDLEETAKVEFSTVPVSFGASDDAGGMTRGSEYGSDWSIQFGSAMAMAMWAYYYQDGSSTPQSMMLENTLTYNSTNARWDYSPIIYWPKSGNMDFFSYAPARIIGGDGKYVTPNAREEFTTFSPSHINHQAILMNCHVPASQITSTTQLETLTKNVNDAANQFDLMFAFQRNVKCAEQTVSSKVNMKFAHVMAGIKFGVESGATFNLPAGTTKVVFGIGRLKTGGTLAICEPSTPGAEPGVVWTLDGQEGTFYYTVDIVDGKLFFTSDEFFFPPQNIENGLVVTAYFYDAGGKTGYRTVRADIKQLERGKCTVLKLTPNP